MKKLKWQNLPLKDEYFENFIPELIEDEERVFGRDPLRKHYPLNADGMMVLDEHGEVVLDDHSPDY